MFNDRTKTLRQQPARADDRRGQSTCAAGGGCKCTSGMRGGAIGEHGGAIGEHGGAIGEHGGAEGGRRGRSAMEHSDGLKQICVQTKWIFKSKGGTTYDNLAPK